MRTSHAKRSRPTILRQKLLSSNPPDDDNANANVDRPLPAVLTLMGQCVCIYFGQVGLDNRCLPFHIYPNMPANGNETSIWNRFKICFLLIAYEWIWGNENSNCGYGRTRKWTSKGGRNFINVVTNRRNWYAWEERGKGTNFISDSWNNS